MTTGAAIICALLILVGLGVLGKFIEYFDDEKNRQGCVGMIFFIILFLIIFVLLKGA